MTKNGSSTNEDGSRTLATDDAVAERARINEQAFGLPHDVAVTVAENLETSGGEKPGSVSVDNARARAAAEDTSNDGSLPGVDRAGSFLSGEKLL